MDDFHQHLSKQLAEHLAERAVVVWYDPRREFTGYVAELCGGAMPEPCQLDTVTVGDVETRLCLRRRIALRGQVRRRGPCGGGSAEAIVLYLPGYTRRSRLRPWPNWS